MYRKFPNSSSEKGNALIYVLIAIALFAGLGFILSRQARNAGTTELDDAQKELYAMQLISYSAQAKSVIDQMLISGSDIDDLDFTQPNQSGFNTAPYAHKVYHPQGGGLSHATIPESIKAQIASSPVAGWYLGRFNNVEWTKSTQSDVILTAYQITGSVCETINQKITGSSDIPALSGNMNQYIVDTATNSDLTVSACSGCEGYTTLCVSNSAVSAYSFYTIVADR